MSRHAIARAAGVSPGTVTRITKLSTKRISRITATAIHHVAANASS